MWIFSIFIIRHIDSHFWWMCQFQFHTGKWTFPILFSLFLSAHFFLARHRTQTQRIFFFSVQFCFVFSPPFLWQTERQTTDCERMNGTERFNVFLRRLSAAPQLPQTQLFDLKLLWLTIIYLIKLECLLADWNQRRVSSTVHDECKAAKFSFSVIES